MKNYSFVTYWIWGLVIAKLLMALAQLDGFPMKPERTEAHQAYLQKKKEHDQWWSRMRKSRERVAFDSRIAGMDFMKDHLTVEAAEVAESVKTLFASEGVDVEQKFEALGLMFLDKQGESRYLTSCARDGSGVHIKGSCEFSLTYASLMEPRRMIQLLSGTSVVSEVIPDIPAEYLQSPVWDEAEPKREVLPRWLEEYGGSSDPDHLTYVWILLFSLFWSFGFILVGGFLTLSNSRSPNPLKLYPTSPLSVMAYLTILPGMLIAQTIRLLATEFRVFGRWISKLRPRNFSNEHESTLDQLNSMREKACEFESSEIIDLIDTVVAKVEQAERIEQLDQLRQSIEDVDRLCDARGEIDRHLRT